MKIIAEHTHNLSALIIQLGMNIDHVINGTPINGKVYNHWLIEHDGYVYEAIGHGVKKWTMAEHNAQKKVKNHCERIEYELNLTNEELKLALNYLEKQKDKKYEYANFYWHLRKIFTDKWEGDTTDKKLYCIELVILAMNVTGKFNIDPYLNPIEFREELKCA